MKTEKIAIGKIKPNKDNPRIIKDEKFKKLVKSIQDFPEMLEIRPIVVNKDMIVLGGNMRLRACQEAGLKEVHIIKADNLTEKQQSEFVIKDNVGFGEWDWDILANEWDTEKLSDWGLDLPKFDTNINEDEVKQPTSGWFLNIEFDSEEQIQEWYEKLSNEGLNCKIVQ